MATHPQLTPAFQLFLAMSTHTRPFFAYSNKYGIEVEVSFVDNRFPLLVSNSAWHDFECIIIIRNPKQPTGEVFIDIHFQEADDLLKPDLMDFNDLTPRMIAYELRRSNSKDGNAWSSYSYGKNSQLN